MSDIGRGTSKRRKKSMIASQIQNHFSNRMVFQYKSKLRIRFEHQLTKEESSLSTEMQKHLVAFDFVFITKPL